MKSLRQGYHNRIKCEMLGAGYHPSKSEKVSGRKRIDCKSHHALLMSTLAIRNRTVMVEMTKEAGGFKNN